MVEIKFDISTMKKSWVEERWKTNSMYLLQKKKMGGRTMEIKFFVFTIKNHGQKNGGNKISYVYYRKIKKKMDRRTVEIQIFYVHDEKKEKKSQVDFFNV